MQNKRDIHETRVVLLLCVYLFVALWLACAWASPDAKAANLPDVTLQSGGLVVTQSCRVRIPPGCVIPDLGDAGVIQIAADNVRVEFAKGSVLRGSPEAAEPDTYKGYGIRIQNHRGVTIANATITGFWCGIWATNADGLILDGVDGSDNRRAHLKSTPAAEDESDWLFGHENDQHQWLTQYGAAFYVERSDSITVRDCRVWHGQNAFCLDRVSASKIYDNDFSFNSGWGVALWRCSSNVISRNALDFCVRGYSHGVYNRGQDSAGIFAFEQNNGNIITENSVTHGGDGFFGFAGREALGDNGEHPLDWYRHRGNSDNLLVHNDFSYATAHGIENTFSFGNRYSENRIVGNAICGIWAGYSRQILITGNDLEDNGEMGYGLERGGVNIDHGGDNLILGNRFRRNRCGVHLWGGTNPDFDKKFWGQVNGYASTGSVVAGNVFDHDALAFQFRGPGEVELGSNQLIGVTRELLAEPSYKVNRNMGAGISFPSITSFPVFGTKHPVGARNELRGRENIIMTEWGPWDHVSPLVRLLKLSGGTAIYQVLKVPSDTLRTKVAGKDVVVTTHASETNSDTIEVQATSVKPGVHAFHLEIDTGSKPLARLAGTLLAAKWRTTFFKWPPSIDPRTNLVAYRKLSSAPSAVSVVLNDLNLKYGMGGPSELGLSKEVSAANLGRDHFGMAARTQLPLPAGTWDFTCLSDDGVRVCVDEKPIIENWSWHGPTRDTAQLKLANPKTVDITVEHFQIDGYAVLEFSITAAVGSGQSNH